MQAFITPIPIHDIIYIRKHEFNKKALFLKFLYTVLLVQM
ncbi:hypothetical protein RINTHM_4080 [Richelia intracellularis HM01]|nr:hypothetical protein RINTHM_4080 [Richelia intracellularis HM01]